MPIVDVNGRPITSEPAREATLADLADLLRRMGDVAERLSVHHPARAALIESAQWLSKLAQELVASRRRFTETTAENEPGLRAATEALTERYRAYGGASAHPEAAL